MDRPQPSRRRHGWDHRNCDLGAGLQLPASEYLGAARRDPQAEWVLDGAIRQVSRGPGVRVEPDRALRPLAHGVGVRALLRLHRRREPSDYPALYDGTTPTTGRATTRSAAR